MISLMFKRFTRWIEETEWDEMSLEQERRIDRIMEAIILVCVIGLIGVYIYGRL